MGNIAAETDADLLARFSRDHAQDAFTEIVKRHVNLVYSAGLRQVRSPQLAEEISQSVFSDLARNAGKLKPDTVLAAWLHSVTRRTAVDVIRKEARQRLREQIAVEMTAMNATESCWLEIEPMLDEAVAVLDESDRAAVLLRYFENKSLREVGAALGVSDDAAQKRVSRAVERLREFFSKRNVTIGASGLTILISANAVQSAPVGLAVAISSAALAGTAATTSTLIAATKTIAMTTLQKTIVAATVAVLAGAGIYEARQNAKLREQTQRLQQQQAPFIEQMQQLQNSFVEATNRLMDLLAENSKLKSNSNQNELLKLRGEVSALRAQLGNENAANKKTQQPSLSSAQEYLKRARSHERDHEYEAALDDLNKALELNPDLADAYTSRAALYAHNLPSSYGGYAKAIADYTRYFELKPKDASFRHNRGLYFEQLGQFDNAIADYSMVIEDPDMDFSHQGDGKKDKDKLIALDHLYRGRIYLRQKDYNKAIADFTAALQLDPQVEGAHLWRGECYEQIGDTEKAQQDFAIEPKAR